MTGIIVLLGLFVGREHRYIEGNTWMQAWPIPISAHPVLRSSVVFIVIARSMLVQTVWPTQLEQTIKVSHTECPNEIM